MNLSFILWLSASMAIFLSAATASRYYVSTNNILKPADGRPVTLPTQDMVIGHYFLTTERSDLVGEGRAFSSVAEAYMAFDRHELAIGAPCRIRPLPLRLNSNCTSDWVVNRCALR